MSQALLSKQAAEDNSPFPYGTVQAVIPASSPSIVALASVLDEIAEEDLDGRGRDIGPPHITLRYGIQGEDVSAVKSLLMTQRPFAITLGPTSSFPPSATREVAVVIATIECAELRALNQRLGEIVDFVDSTHAYEPHVTIAYVRPDVAEKYAGNQITAGHSFVITEVVIRTQSQKETIITLSG
jgi:2'-5' RNA ligase